MGGRKDRDYNRLAAEFITGEMSMRELAASNAIAPASLARAFRKKDPVTNLDVYQQRNGYRASLQSKALDLLGDRDAVQTAQRMEKILNVGDKVLDLFIRQTPNLEAAIAEGKVPITVRDAVAAADLIRSVIGVKRPEEEKKPNGLNLLQVFGNGAEPAPIQELLAATRSKLADDRASERTANGAAEASGD